ncbi:translin-associated protein X [Anoplophora glabripennis]|uniref:translin-associated protein X n=1 Tax=Anoplophora glabripennis TaxID=217634 RepID=UPI000875707E|nr:translin-associated protein X [Anoplophora glabripennis]
MSKFRGNRNKRSKPVVGDKAKETLENMDENNPVLVMFREYSLELDSKLDRYERIIKLSRDVTIEAKRVIFLLHNTNTDIESKKKSILEEADNRLKALVDTSFKAIAKELQNQDAYQYHRAYTGGLQEFIEALTFCQFIKNASINPWDNIDQLFRYEDEECGKYSLLFPQYDFILGIADFTGELMRRCINTLGVGNVDECFKLCDFVRYINTGFLGLISPGNKELSRKAYVLRQSLAKMELVCYNIQIRGTEVPKHMLIGVIESPDVNTDDDEGFF